MKVKDVIQGVVLLQASGALVLGQETAKLRSRIADLRGQYREIWLDLAGLSKIDAAGLGLLAEAYSTCRSEGTALRLYDVSAKTAELLQLVRLFTIFGACVRHKTLKKAA